jgi:hypothetical protein
VLDRGGKPHRQGKQGHDGSPTTHPAGGDPTVSRRDPVPGPLCVPGRARQASHPPRRPPLHPAAAGACQPGGRPTGPGHRLQGRHHHPGRATVQRPGDRADLAPLMLARANRNADIAHGCTCRCGPSKVTCPRCSPNSAPGIEPTSPPATWNGSDVKDGDAETACHQPESIPPRSSARYIGWAVAVPARHWLDGGCQCAQGFLDLEVGYDPSGRMSRG